MNRPQRPRPAVTAERRSPPTDLQQLVDRMGERVAPDRGALVAWYGRYRDQHRRRLAFDLALVEETVPRGARLLEIGAVPLLMTATLVERDYEVAAVDVAPERFSKSIVALGLDVRACDIETQPLPFGDREFDLVLFHELFEHLRIDPIHVFEEMRRVLRPGGTLLLSTPNLRSFRGLRNLLLHGRGHASSGGIYEQYEKLRTLGHMGHVREYTVREVVEFLERLGFRVERVVHRGGHGTGVVGLAERVAPSLRPFFSLVARREGRASWQPGGRP